MDDVRSLLFLRHGETDWNAEFRYQGSVDIPLNSLGEKQALIAASRLKNWIPDRCVVSPQKRALRTAEIVAEKWNRSCEPEVIDGLREISFGEWEGQQVGDVMQSYGDDYMRWREDPGSWTPPGGESFLSAEKRVKGALFPLLDFEGSRFLVVAHGGIIRAALSALLGVSPAASWKMRLGNCSLTGVSVWNGRFSLSFLNDCVHEGLPVEKVSDLPLNF